MSEDFSKGKRGAIVKADPLEDTLRKVIREELKLEK